MSKIIKQIQNNSLSTSYLKALSQEEAEKIYTSLFRVDSELAETFSEKWSEWHEYYDYSEYNKILRQFV